MTDAPNRKGPRHVGAPIPRIRKKRPAHPNQLKALAAGRRMFQKGVGGNPHGKPIGARNAINKAFLTDVLAVWEESGRAALQAFLTEDRRAFLEMMVGLVSQPAGEYANGEPPGADAPPIDRVSQVRAELAEMFAEPPARPDPPLLEGTAVRLPNGKDPH